MSTFLNMSEIIPENENRNLEEIFEEIVNNEPESPLPRLYREMLVSQNDIDRVRNNRGEYCSAPVSGSGYSGWYFYHTMDDRLVFMIVSYGDREYWSWQYGVPPESVANWSLPATADITWSLPQEYINWSVPPEEEEIHAPLQLLRSCTRFSCACTEQGRRPCSTYSSCMGCYRSFDECICD